MPGGHRLWKHLCFVIGDSRSSARIYQAPGALLPVLTTWTKSISKTQMEIGLLWKGSKQISPPPLLKQLFFFLCHLKGGFILLSFCSLSPGTGRKPTQQICLSQGGSSPQSLGIFMKSNTSENHPPSSCENHFLKDHIKQPVVQRSEHQITPLFIVYTLATINFPFELD